MDDRVSLKNMTPYLLILLVTVCLLFHAQYSFCQSDESFYLAVVNRLYQGDLLITDEWHPVQFYAPILLPLYSLYMLFSGNGDGMILFFRLMYILFAGFTGLMVIKTFHHYCGRWLAAIASLMLLLYSRANISGMSYYNLSVQFTVLALCMTAVCFHGKKGRQKILCSLLSGVFIACAVLCCPYLAIFAVIGLIIFSIIKESRHAALCMAGGILLSAALYIVFFLRHIRIDDLLVNIPYILNDPQHTQTLAEKWTAFWNAHQKVFPLPMLGLIALVCVILMICTWKKRKMPSMIWLAYFIVSLLVLSKSISIAKDNICYAFYLPLCYCMLPVVLQYTLENGNRILSLAFVAGLCLAASFYFASNTGLDAMTTGLVVSAAASVMCASCIIKIRPPKKSERYKYLFNKVAIVAMAVAVIFASSAHRLIGFYRDAPMDQLTCRIKAGPASGLLTSQENARQYTTIYSTIQSVRQRIPEALVFHTAKTPWAYLCSSWHYGTPTAWTTQLDSEHLAAYYQLNPEKVPDLIFIYADNVGSFQTVPYNSHKQSLTPNVNNMSGAFYSIIQENAVRLTANEYVTVYHFSHK